MGNARALVYSHDTFGLGNLRRMLAVAGSLLDRGTVGSVLLITGSPSARNFCLDPRID